MSSEIKHSSSIYQFLGILASLLGTLEYLFYFTMVATLDHSYVSTLLHRDIMYRVVTTFVLTMQYILLLCFFARLRLASVFCLVYIVLYCVHPHLSWIFEHFAIIFLNCSFIVFFTYNDPNPEDSFRASAQYTPVTSFWCPPASLDNKKL